MKQHGRMGAASAAVVLWAVVSQATVVPTNLPPPDEKAPAKNKPVKVYILSGQSNMVGFGLVHGNKATYSRIYLSADPTILPAKMNVESAAVLPHYVFQGATGEARGAIARVYAGAYDASTDYDSLKPLKQDVIPLGDVSSKLPTVEGPHTVVVKAFIEVPISGLHYVHAGYGGSAHAIVVVDDTQVYRKEPNEERQINGIRLAKDKRHAVTITYLEEGSAVFWLKLTGIEGKGFLSSIVQDGTLPFLKDETGAWTVRNDVMLCESLLDKNKFKGGRSTMLSATANGKFIGPELGFGQVMGYYHDEPVLLIKASMGNRGMGYDILPEGSKRFDFGDRTYAGYGDFAAHWEKGTEPPSKGGWYAGKQYDEFTQAIHGVLDNFDTLYPQFKDQGYDVAGFVWWQGHKDGGDLAHRANYGKNLAQLIKSWRKEFGAPDAKWVIATVAFQGEEMGANYRQIADEQLSVSGESGRFPEFKGNVKTTDARPFWRHMGESPSAKDYHYNHNAETYYLTGDALGRAMVELLGGDARPGPSPVRPGPIPDKPLGELTLGQMADLVHTPPYLSKYGGKDDRVPTHRQMVEMGPALRPMIIADVIPSFISEAPKVPAYRRTGASLMPLVELRHPDQKTKEGDAIVTQLEQIIDLYESAGINDYSWNVIDPRMKGADWDYFMFDPPETKDKKLSGRFRKVTLPEGMQDWHAVDFDAEANGWKRGVAPFGQRGGKLLAQRSDCHGPHCGCGTPPKTLWNKEVLLMRRTFDVPEVKGDNRYRLIVGGGAHPFSGEGFEIYVNGKLLARRTAGNMKKGGIRGAYFYRDFLPELESGRITVAIKSFLRYTHHNNKLAPTTGHLDAWLETATLPEAVLNLAATSEGGPQ